MFLDDSSSNMLLNSLVIQHGPATPPHAAHHAAASAFRQPPCHILHLVVPSHHFPCCMPAAACACPPTCLTPLPPLLTVKHHVTQPPCACFFCVSNVPFDVTCRVLLRPLPTTVLLCGVIRSVAYRPTYQRFVILTVGEPVTILPLPPTNLPDPSLPGLAAMPPPPPAFPELFCYYRRVRYTRPHLLPHCTHVACLIHLTFDLMGIRDACLVVAIGPYALLYATSVPVLRWTLVAPFLSLTLNDHDPFQCYRWIGRTFIVLPHGSLHGGRDGVRR